MMLQHVFLNLKIAILVLNLGLRAVNKIDKGLKQHKTKLLNHCKKRITDNNEF